MALTAVRDTSLDFNARLSRRMKKRLVQAFSFMVATAWTSVFTNAFDTITGGHTTLLGNLLYALLFTVLATALATVLDDDV
jgi:hypothetical protein